LTLWDGLVVGMAISGGMRLVIVGATIGIVLAGTATWAISGFLFGVQPNDVATFIAIPALLSSVALFAAWIPSPPSEPDRSGAGPTSRIATTHSDHKRSPHHRAPPTQCTRKNALSALNAEKIPSAP